tara:strand:+ start:7747 stop:7887 length:141 start_codon:yes stop_codon:yes gene_type:complete
MKVKAIERGYYNRKVRDEDEVFEIKSQKHLGTWMEPVKQQQSRSAE